MLKTTLLNGITTEKDKDYTELGLNTIRPGVITGLEVTTNSVGTGKGFVRVTRTATTPEEIILVRVEITEAEVIDTSGTKKVWIEINQDNINDPALNDANGTLAGTVETGADYPAGNYIPLADIVAGVITDERKVATIKAKNINGAEVFFETDAGGIKVVFKKADGDEADVEVENIYAITDYFLNGKGTNTALGLVKLNASGKIPASLLESSPVLATSLDKLAGESIALGDAVYIDSTDRKAYKTQASNTAKLNFIWIATNAGAIDETITIHTAGINSSKTGLTADSDYYLSDTAGAISTTAGTNIVKIGKSISQTEILITRFTWFWNRISRSMGVNYLAETDGIVTCYVNNGTDSSYLYVYGYVGVTTGDTLIASSGFGRKSGVSFPVKKGQYYRCTKDVNEGTNYFNFTPLI